MGCLMNLLWLLLGGIFTAVEYLISSLLMMLTIIGIPFGMQTLKLAGLALWPFGKEVRSGNRSGGCLYILMNILWIFLGGIWICLSHLVFGAVLCITIIGIPFGLQHFICLFIMHSPFYLFRIFCVLFRNDYFSSFFRISTRRILPLIVLGSSSTNSITRGYL